MPLPGLEGCSMLAWAQSVRVYGSQGSNGRTGRSGRDGTAGQSQSVVVDGTPASLVLAGSDGEDGESGENGYRPRCGGQPRNVAYDLRAPDGGAGGSGGAGGGGGNGGDLRVYYSDRSHLQQLSVDARGGRAGRGGSGGRGALGCRCDIRQWTVQTCTGTPGQADHSCRNTRYTCRDGRSGGNGAFGRDGALGVDGQLSLINQLEPLQPENPAISVGLTTLVNQPARLSRNLWAERAGANALLAPGSRVRDTYREYIGRVEGDVSLDWQAPRPIGGFAGGNLRAEIQPDGSLTAAFPDGLWANYTSRRQGDQLTIVVTNAVRASDVTRLAWGGVQGSGANLSAAVLDLAGEAASLNTQFRVTLRTTADDPRGSRLPRYVTVYDDVLPADLVRLEGNRFELALGRLPIDRGPFSRGTHAQLEITAVRSLGNNRAEQQLSWRGQF
ncbi:MAG: collagen-like protein [Leptolyngbya sp. DLM2.Bin27]|nr:MAG: collagen-like protein [Leptolyngbya sp. DLM2.Bin27]